MRPTGSTEAPVGASRWCFGYQDMVCQVYQDIVYTGGSP